ncbi:MAG: hypothetical protein WCF36_04740 [Candidatus Nanopelagicales bacterium]
MNHDDPEAIAREALGMPPKPPTPTPPPPPTPLEVVASLLTHHLRGPAMEPAVIPVQHPRGAHGIALVLDGWYASPVDAADVADYWRDLLAEAVTAIKDGAP